MPNTKGRKLIVHDKELGEYLAKTLGKYGIEPGYAIALFSEVMTFVIGEAILGLKKDSTKLAPEMQRIALIRRIHIKSRELLPPENK